jgi:hypothetical protein
VVRYLLELTLFFQGFLEHLDLVQPRLLQGKLLQYSKYLRYLFDLLAGQRQPSHHQVLVSR